MSVSSKGQRYVVGAVLGGLGALLAAGVLLSPDFSEVAIGSEAPNFRALDLATGDSASLDRYRGRVTLLNVWATWCAPCEAEMPSMQRLYDELGAEGLAIVAVSIDAGDPRGVRDWAAARNLSFDVLHDRSGEIQRIYYTTGVPESFVIDRHGVIVKKLISAIEWDHPSHKALFRRLLIQPAGGTGG